MILEFKVENFLSIKDEQVLSFEATSDKHLSEYHIVEIKPGVKVLKMAMIYGANASGKTNILKALEFISEFAVTTRNRGEKTNFIPFKFDNTTVNNPGKFEITFFIGDVKFIYSFVVDENIVYEEKVIFYTSSQPSVLFIRKYDKISENFSLEFGSKIKIKQAYKDLIIANTLNNMSVISTFSKVEIRIKKDEKKFNKFSFVTSLFIKIFNYLSSLFIVPDKFYFLDDLILDDIKQKPEFYKKYILKNLKKADFNIIDFEIIGNRTFKEDNFKKLEILFTHKLPNNKTTYLLSEYEESQGTLLYFGLLAMSISLTKGEDFFAIDELESSLHPELVNHFINTFLYESKNIRSQFIFTTHNISLLDEDFVRKDIVWFTEKEEDGSTKLYSLSDFNIRKELSFSKAYKSGNFGATPNLDNVY